MQLSNRIEWIDSLKGFLLLCICFSHFGFVPEYLSYFAAPTGAIWVPAFFFLSGLLFSSKRHSSVKYYVISKSKSLLIPFLFFFVVFTLVDWNIVLNTKVLLMNNITSLINGGGPEKASPLWFVFSLYLASILYFLIDKYISSNALKFIFLVLLFVLGQLAHISNFYLPLGLNRVFTAMLFFGVAHIFKNRIFEMINILKKKLYTAILIMLFGLLSYYLYSFNPDAVMAQNRFNNLFLYFISSFGGISTLVLFFSIKRIQSFTYLNKIFIYIANNALIILATHVYLIIVLDNILKFTGFTNFQIIFYIKFLIIALTMRYLLIPIINNKFYFIVGKSKP